MSKFDKKESVFLRKALLNWKEIKLLDEAQFQRLNSDIEENAFDWGRLAKYCMWVSVICIFIAVSAFLADEALVAFIRKIFNAPHLVKCLGFSALATGSFWWGIKRKSEMPENTYSNEALLFLGVVATAAAIYELGRVFDNGSGHFSILLLLSFFVYGILGFLFSSNLIWLFSIFSLGSWFGTETGYASGWGAYYLGMNYPLRFVFFGTALVGVALRLETVAKFKNLFKTTLVMGLLYLFVALWTMSIFGNYNDLELWNHTGHLELFLWSLLMAIASGAAIFHGLKYGSRITKGFGITFLMINLYTRYFEYFWNTMHKAIFFGILGVSFWFLGARAERLWKIVRSPESAKNI